jgi:hypothetical protein
VASINEYGIENNRGGGGSVAESNNGVMASMALWRSGVAKMWHES